MDDRTYYYSYLFSYFSYIILVPVSSKLKLTFVNFFKDLINRIFSLISLEKNKINPPPPAPKIFPALAPFFKANS